MRFTNFFFLKNQTRFFASAIICTTKSLSFFALVFFGIWSLVIWIGCFFCSFLKSSSSSSSLSRLLDFKLDFFIVFSRALYRLFKDTRTHARTHARFHGSFFASSHFVIHCTKERGFLKAFHNHFPIIIERLYSNILSFKRGHF